MRHQAGSRVHLARKEVYQPIGLICSRTGEGRTGTRKGSPQKKATALTYQSVDTNALSIGSTPAKPLASARYSAFDGRYTASVLPLDFMYRSIVSLVIESLRTTGRCTRLQSIWRSKSQSHFFLSRIGGHSRRLIGRRVRSLRRWTRERKEPRPEWFSFDRNGQSNSRHPVQSCGRLRSISGQTKLASSGSTERPFGASFRMFRSQSSVMTRVTKEVFCSPTSTRRPKLPAWKWRELSRFSSARSGQTPSHLTVGQFWHAAVCVRGYTLDHAVRKRRRRCRNGIKRELKSEPRSGLQCAVV